MVKFSIYLNRRVFLMAGIWQVSSRQSVIGGFPPVRRFPPQYITAKGQYPRLRERCIPLLMSSGDKGEVSVESE